MSIKVTKEQFIGVTYDELLTENDKLREQSERLFDKTLELATENSKLRELCKLCERENDNAKLRELLSVMAYCNQFRRDCDGCSMNGAAGIITERAGCDELLDRLRELGVDVK